MGLSCLEKVLGINQPNLRFKSDNNPAAYGAIFENVGQTTHITSLLWVVTA
jgi:hypothetical protein